MSVNSGIRSVDTLVALPSPASDPKYQMVQAAMGQHSGDPTKLPVGYMFRDDLKLPEGEDPVGYTLRDMDRFDIEWAVVGVDWDPAASRAVKEHPDRFIGITGTDPNRGMEGIRDLERDYRELGIRGTAILPAFVNPPVPIDDRKMYPIYAKCVELDIPVFVNVGVPGPRVPMAPQRVDLLDEVCWFFPELKIVMRHGGEPWDELAVKLMLKWPNLYYSTSAFAPRYYPKSIVDYANKRGSDKVMFAGYYGAGLTWDRVFKEFEELPLREHVWPQFLRSNALRVLGIES